ncbi:hypothetical protein [Methylomicrobium lacus]|uniref:hypothetical protein n=1 Tax=Methylomicrobium lacus TaxID=136992 RepID=UPI00126904A6|nr:hypothetical protein [Methylomicrobium lacus]
MRGGKRPGAGRKPSEPTKMVRVPISLIPEIQALIAHRRETLNADAEIKPAIVEPSLIPETEIKSGGASASLIDEAEIKQADTPVPFDKDALRSLERVPKDVQRQLKSDYGSLTNAVKAGIRAQRYDGKWRAVLPG